MSSGLLTVIFITKFLSPDVQGYYYTFYSLISLNLLFELGINFSIIQFASHEMVRLTWMPDGTLSGSPESKRRLQSLIQFAIKWYSFAGLLMLVVLIPIGLIFFRSNATEEITLLNIGLPWFLLVFFTAINLTLGAMLAVLEGCGKITEVAKLRFIQSVLSVFSVWAVLALGGGVYALVANNVALVITGFAWIGLKYRSFYKDIYLFSVNLPGICWKKDLWPFQWRIAISSMSGYFISQLFIPLLFASHGPVAAGKMGMSMQIIMSMNSVALAWISTKAPTFGNLIAMGQRKRLDELFFRSLIQSVVLLVLMVITVLSIFYYFWLIGSPYEARILPTELFSILAIACISNHIIRAEADYLRAHKKEPFMVLYVAIGVTTALMAWLTIPEYGTAGAAYSYLIPTLFIGLFGGTFLFLVKRREYARDA